MIKTKYIEIGGLKFKVAQPGLGALREFDTCDKSTEELAASASFEFINAARNKSGEFDESINLMILSAAETIEVVVILYAWHNGRDMKEGEMQSL